MESSAVQNDLYGFTGKLLRLWTKAEALYRNGNRNPDEYFDAEETEILSSLGLNVMDVYDYVEDFTVSGDPDFATFVLVSAEKIFYFFDELNGQPSDHQIQNADLPPKDESIDGVRWLPRILVKARAKLRGELVPETMYGCGGDRKFLQSYGIHPVDFLRKVRYSADNREVIDWVVARGNF
jgi:hypothetical protein